MAIGITENGEHYGKMLDAVAQLNSYNNILKDYMDKHEEISQMMHAYLITKKMQEQINILQKYFNKNN